VRRPMLIAAMALLLAACGGQNVGANDPLHAARARMDRCLAAIDRQANIALVEATCRD
jgi:hypothetical protein